MLRFSCTMLVLCFLGIIFASGVDAMQAGPDNPAWMKASIASLQTELAATYGQEQRDRISRGISQVAEFWRGDDGDQTDFESFIRTNFAGDEGTLDEMFNRFESHLELLDGHMLEIMLNFRRQADLDIGPILPFDEIFAGYSPSAHVLDDIFENKLAFVILLNFPLTTLDQRLSEGETWTRRQWAEARLAERFSKRIPAEVNMALSQANAEADQYVARYNIWMHHLVNKKGERLFPPKMRLLSHWNLRDEIKAAYSEGKAGFAKQQMIARVMERIVTQSIPAVVVDNPYVDWNPVTNEVSRSKVNDSDAPAPEGMTVSNAAEPDSRYAIILKTFHAARMEDPYSPTAPTLIERRFNEDREIPEERVEAMFKQILSSPYVAATARIIESRLGRKLQPFDIWYNGFRSRGAYTEAELDKIVKERYPTPEAYKRDMPSLLMKLGFSEERAQYLADHIDVDPARGSGHAWGAAMRGQHAHLRTRTGKDGMDYKGFNIAVHEMGHNVEQVVSLNDVDHTLLEGVPNTAFTEAIAFVFQSRDLKLLGLDAPANEQSEAFGVLNDFWSVYEIAGVALLDMGIWHWMYDHPDANPAELKAATLEIAKDIWNRYYAPHFGQKDVILLAIYSHILHSFLYIPDYPLGHLIALQVEEHLKKTDTVGTEIERMVKMGSVTPDIWMKNATGSPVGAEAMLEATAHALERLGKRP